jgi:hypothetical protein
MKRILPIATFVFAGCGGGGGSSPQPVAPTATPTPSYTLTGSVVAYEDGVTPRAGFTVTFGTFPNYPTCNLAQTSASTVSPCAVPGSVIATTTTDSNGHFTLPGLAAPNGMLMIGKDGTYATLHRGIYFTQSGITDLGKINIAALTVDEQAQLADYNQRRATISFPTSYPDQVVDEYAQELVRQWAQAVASGAIPFDDPSVTTTSGYIERPGALFQFTNNITSVGATAFGWLDANTGWFSEKAVCPGGDWLTCPFSKGTGHYIYVSRTDSAFIGISGSKPNSIPLSQSNGIPGVYAYGVIIILNVQAGQGSPV